MQHSYVSAGTLALIDERQALRDRRAYSGAITQLTRRIIIKFFIIIIVIIIVIESITIVIIIVIQTIQLQLKENIKRSNYN